MYSNCLLICNHLQIDSFKLRLVSFGNGGEIKILTFKT